MLTEVRRCVSRLVSTVRALAHTAETAVHT